MKVKRRKRWTLLLGLGSILLILLIQLFVIYFPRTLLIDFLFYEDEPKNADAIILMSGDTVRIKKAAELYHAGYADKVLLTNALEAGSRPEDAESYGIPHHALLIENKATSTYENALFSKPIVLEHEIESALVVTSNYHMRRTRLAFERVFHDTDVSFIYVPYHHDNLSRNSWEKNEKLFQREYKKLIGGYFLYFDGIITPVRKRFEEIMEKQ